MIVVKIGGSVVGDLHPSFIPDVKRASGGGVVLVHGGGREVSRVSEQLGREPRFVTSPGGIRSRYTDIETVEIFAMVMAGRVNKSIVRMLQRGGIDAVGLSGVDAGLIRAQRKKRLIVLNERGRRQAIDGGYTGKITAVNSRVIRAILEMGLTPVISPVALSEEFDLLNVDGDRAAAYVAGAIGADRVLFATDVDGLLMGGKLVERLSQDDAKKLRPKAGPGMEKKLLAATEALGMGVREALIASGRRENPISAAVSHDACTVIRNG